MIQLFVARLRLIKRKLFFRKGFVADIGAGHNPSIFASLLIEKFIDSAIHRQGQEMELGTAVILQADIENIPLKDDSIDFSICSHVLEHVTNPEGAIKEISRVSKQGYIELPNKFSEYLFDREDHLWLCTRLNNGNIRMEPKSVKFEKEFSRLFKVFIRNNHKNWYQLYFRTFHEWNICLRWSGSVPIEVKGSPQKMVSEVSQSIRLKDYSLMSTFEKLLKRLIRKLFFRQTQMNFVVKKMQCNSCCSPFHQKNLDLICKCGVKYKIDGNILRISNE